MGQPVLSLAVNTVQFLLVLRRRRPGIVLGAGGWGISGAAGALRLTGHRAPLIVKVNIHSEGDGMARRGHRLAPRIILGVERFVLRTADLVTTVGESTSRFAADAGVAEDRVIQRSAAVSGGFVPERPPDASRDPMLVGCVARLEPRKAIDVLLRAVAQVRTVHAGVKVEIAGQGARRAELEALAADLGLSECVTFRGWVRRPDIPAFLARAAIFVLPSRADEGLPKVVVEAGLAGCAVVGTDVRGTNELVVPGVTGELVPPDDPAALAAVLIRLLAGPDEVARLARAAREVAVAHQMRHLRRRDELRQRVLALLSDG